jgi:lipopolysaccharide transport system ATP-binding protein
MSDIAIQVSNVSKMYRIFHSRRYQVMDLLGLPIPDSAYEAFWALRDIDLLVPCGRKVGIIGQNGAGKSTLLKIIAGQIKPTKGKAIVHGKVQALMELGTGFHPEFTGRENVFTSLSYQGVIGNEAKHKFHDIVDFSELEEFIDHPIKTYSAGMYARLAFSVATAIEPEILIIDEVLGAGDAYFAAKCVDRMKSLTEKGATVLFVSHDMASVQRLCAQCIWINRGRIVENGETLQVCKKYLKDVRDREERRLRAFNMRLQKGSAEIITSSENDIVRMIFHFIVDDWAIPKETHPLSKLAIIRKDEILAEINIGDAADNAVSSPNHVIVQRGYIEWGEPIRLSGRYCREFKSMGGRYLHAALQLSVNASELDVDEDMEIQLDYYDKGKEQFHLEIYEDNRYRRVGTVIPTGSDQWLKSRWKLYSLINTDNSKNYIKKLELSKTSPYCIDILGGIDAEINRVRLIDGEGEERNVFQLGEPINIEVHFQINKILYILISAIVVYTADGIPVYKDIVDHSLSKYNSGSYSHTWTFDPAPFGPRDYVISAALYPSFDWGDDSRLQSAYSLWDRRSRFKIEQPMGVEVELGLLNFKAKTRFQKN